MVIWRGVALCLLLFVWIVARWWSILSPTDWHDDESIYFGAFAAVAEGRSPYGGGYLYPPIFAQAGAALVDLLGPGRALAAMRLANIVGLTLLFWLALRPIRSLRLRWGLAALAGGFSPAVDIALRWGNLTPLIGALLISAVLLLEWRAGPRWPRGVLAALTSAVGILIKPLGAIVPLLLLLPMPRRDGSTRKIVAYAAFAGLALMAIGLLGVPGLTEFLQLGGTAERSGTAGRSVSLLRLLYAFGVELTPLTMVSLVMVASGVVWFLFLRRRGLDSSELLSFLTVAALLATPIVWNHTTLMALPVQAGALAIWIMRRHRASWWEGALVILAILSQHFAGGVGGVEDQARALQGLAILVPSLAPIFLFWYQLRAAPGVPGEP